VDIPKFNEAAARGPRKTGAKSPVITRRTLQSSLGRRAVRPRIRANAACEPPIAFVATRAPARDGTRCVAPPFAPVDEVHRKGSLRIGGDEIVEILVASH